MARKLYYKIGEACKLLDIQPYVLRYWETEFPVLSPRKSKSGQRVYDERDLEMIQRIKELLYDEGYTIAGAKKKLEGDGEDEAAPPAEAAQEEKPVKKAAAPAGKAAASKAPAPAAKRKAAKPAAKKTAKKAATRTAPADEKARLRQLEKGALKALAEARELLAMLDSPGRKR